MTSPEVPPRRQVAGVFAISFGAVLVLLLVRSRELFAKVIYEEGDFAANSIITYHAKHLDLLVGNYSRVGFSHPGPAYFYLQAVGEWLLHDVLGLVPSEWNGQAVAILALNALCLALTLAVVYTWLGPEPTVAAGGGALAFVAAHDQLFSSTWMPFAYFAPFLLLLVAGASVSAGRRRHLWLLVFAGGLLVHGHASFLFFVPLLAAAVLLAQRRELHRDPAAWLPALGVLAVFLLPIVVNLVLHWPGQFPLYFGYADRGLNPPWDTALYQLGFWSSNPGLAAAVAVGLFLGVRLVASRTPRPEAGRFLRAGMRTTAAATGLFFVYALYGIDNLNDTYLGYFSRAMPLSLLMLGLAGGTAVARAAAAAGGVRMRWRPAVRAAPVLALLAGLVAASLSPSLVNRRLEVPGVPRALDAMSARAAGRPIVLEVRPDGAWPEAISIVVAGTRRGQRVCMADEAWRLLATAEFVCTPADLAAGERFVVVRRGYAGPAGSQVADLSPSLVYRADPLP